MKNYGDLEKSRRGLEKGGGEIMTREIPPSQPFLLQQVNEKLKKLRFAVSSNHT